MSEVKEFKNKKIVVIGDTHGRKEWRNIVDVNEDADLFIFLGDYVSSHEDIGDEEQLMVLREILDFKEANSDKVILLRGNHDLQHLGYSWADCSGYFRIVGREMQTPEFKERFLNDTQWIYVIDKVVFSHAGISKRWCKDFKIDNIEDINLMKPSAAFAFRPCKMSDYYGISETQGPVWIRPQTLIECGVKGYTQVVGHTPFKHIINVKQYIKDKDPENYKSSYSNVWVCDTCFEEYLVIEDGKFRVQTVIKDKSKENE